MTDTWMALKITPETLPLIAALNNGMEPEIEETNTFFVFSSIPESHANIITETQLEESVKDVLPINLAILAKW